MSERREQTEQLSAEQLLDELAIQDEAEATAGLQSVAEADSTLKSLKAELDTLASQVREPAPVVPFEDESDCRRVTELVEVLGLEPSLAGHAQNDAGLPDPEPLGELGQYLLLAKLGQGGMGTVYKALHTRLDKIVAIKLLPEQKTSDTHAVARFEQEMRAVGKLEHANIVRAMDANEHEETHYLVMEYVDGVDLSDLVRRVGPLPIADACELIRQAAIGLQHAHEHSLVHRDIKPSNLMLTRLGQLKILDLGLARLHNGNHGELTSTGQMMGTIDYMAPEQTGNSHNVDIRADIYGLGATLFKLLCDRAPYADERHDTIIKKLNALATQPVPSIRKRREEVPAQLATVLSKMLAKEAGGRYATPQEVADALAPFCAGNDLALLLENATAKDAKHAHDESKVATHESLRSGSVETDPTLDMPDSSPLPLGEGQGEGLQSSPHAPREELTPASLGRESEKFGDSIESTQSMLPSGADKFGEGLPTSPKPPTEGLQETDAGQATGRPAVKQVARSGDLATTPSMAPSPLGEGRGEGLQPWYSNRRNQIITVAAALGGILLLAAITLFFQTKDGTIVVEIDDPEGLIQVTVDGEDIVITDKNAGEPIRLKPGDHKLNVTRAGLEFSTDNFTLKRGNKVVLSVKLVDGEVRVIQKGDTDTVLGQRRIDNAPIRSVAAPIPWKLGPDKNILPGIVPRPARLPGIKRWQVETTAPRTLVKCVDWSDDGQFIATGSDTGMIRMFDARTLECQQVLPATLCNSVAWSNDGKRLVVTGAFGGDGTPWPAGIWTRHGSIIPLMKEGILEGAADAVWSPDGVHVAVAGGWQDSLLGSVDKISIWSSDGKLIRSFDCDPATSVSWSPDGQLIAAGSYNGKVRIWTVDGEAVANIQAYKRGPNTHVSWSPDSQWFATLGFDPETQVKIWRRDGTAGPEYLPDDKHRHNLYDLAWSPGGRRLAIAGVGGIHLLNIDGLFQKFVRGDYGNNFAVAWSPDGERIVVGGGEGLTVMDVDGEKRNELVRRFAPCQVAWSPRSDRLAISALPMSTYGTNAHLLQPNGGFDKAIDRRFAAGRPEWSPDGKRIALGWLRTPTSVVLKSGPQDSEIKQLAQIYPAGYTVWNPQGTELASVYYADSEAVLRIWDRDGQALSTIQIPSKAGQVAWHPDGKLLAVGTDSEIFLVHRDGKIEKTVEDHGSYWDLVWSPDGVWLAGSGAEMTRLIRRDGTLGPFLSQNGRSISWSPDSRQVAVGKAERTIEIWNLEGKLLRSLIGHDGNVESVSWSSDGKYLTSGSGGIVINWNATTWEPEWTHVLLGNDQTASFTAAGQVINGDPDLIEERFVYIIEHDDGRLETLKPSEFAARIGQSLRLNAPRTSGRPKPKPPLAIAPFDADQARQHQEAWADYLGVPVEFTNSIGMKFHLIPPGEFLMGSTEEEQNLPIEDISDLTRALTQIQGEGPQHRVRISKPFWLGRCEVTRGQFRRFVEATSYVSEAERDGKSGMGEIDGVPIKDPRFVWNGDLEAEQTENHPVLHLSWNDATAFCQWLSQEQPGAAYSLPTEAQWEYACRAGTTTFWHSGNDVAALEDHAWFGANSDGKSHPVGQLRPNGFGLFDLHGNLYEWCSDWYSEQYYASSAVNDPSGPERGQDRVYRGGNWKNHPRICWSAFRNHTRPSQRNSKIGFRAALLISQELIADVKDGSVGSRLDLANSRADGGTTMDTPLAPTPTVAPFNSEEARKHQEVWAKHLGVPVEFTNSIGMKMRLVPPGEFMMGSTQEEIEQALRLEDPTLELPERFREGVKIEAPRHKVILTRPYYCGVHEVTQEQYAKVIGTNPSAYSFTGKKNSFVVGIDTATHPVEMVTWGESIEFCRKLTEIDDIAFSRLRGLSYRLPSEAEWEYACRAGTTTQFWTGDDAESLRRGAWFDEGREGRTHAIGTKVSNPFGLFDVHGNVMEFCGDWWGAYDTRNNENPTGIPTGIERVVRGGQWRNTAVNCRSAYRNRVHPTAAFTILGFRVVLPISAELIDRLNNGPASRTTSISSKTPDRRAAEWVLGHGGYVDTVRHGRISSNGELPEEGFEIRTVGLGYTDGKVTDDDLQHLVGLKSLSGVGLNGHSQITDAGAAVLASIDSLTQLSLGATGITDVGVKELGSLTTLRKLDLAITKITDAGVAHLNDLTELEHLDLYITDIGDEALGTVAKLSRLEHLGIHKTKGTDAGIAKLVDLPLKRISIDATATGDAALESLAKMETLESIDVGSPLLTDAGLAHLEKLPSLYTLNIKSGDQLTDTGITHVARLPKLKSLQLGAPNVTAEGIKTISTMQGLEKLDLLYTTITDDWLTQLHGMKNLRLLMLAESPEITVSGLVQLMRTLPDCSVSTYNAIDTNKKIAAAKEMLKKDSQEE